MLLKNRYLGVIGMGVLIAWPCFAAAAGDPLINLTRFFEDLFRVQIDGPEIVGRGFDLHSANTPPSNLEERRALHPVQDSEVPTEEFACEGFELKGFSDWRVGFELARKARSQAKGNKITQDMRWPNFWDWNSPVYVSANVNRTLIGNLRSASISVAVLGREFDISEVLNEAEHQIADTALEALFAIRGRGYEPLYDLHIREKEVFLTSSEQCVDFVIFKLRVE